MTRKNKLMKSIALTAFSGTLVFASTLTIAEPAKSEKHAKSATELRQSLFTLIRANMGPLGGMAKGRVPFNAEVVQTNALRINQLSLMISDYTRTDTSGFKVNTDALNKIWTDRADFEKHINDLTKASENLMTVAASGQESAIKKAIGGVGKTCGSCHDAYKAD